ncbi:MAG: type II toxin-antitoxin system VapB family antitoxin [Armatimonadetes bacterium]|nr:type II toxin-antitoxin system VapB family antitoxin [Armatimonadota bacterium]
MRYTIDLPDDLVRDAMRLTGLKTKREVVTLALEELVRKRRLERLRARLGQGNLDLTLEELCRMRGHD